MFTKFNPTKSNPMRVSREDTFHFKDTAMK